MIQKPSIEEIREVIKNFVNFKKIDELLLQGDDELRIMEVAFRALPCHDDYGVSSIIITRRAIKNMLLIFKSLSMPQLKVPLSSKGIYLYTRLGIGLRGLVNTHRKKVLVESLIFYKGEYTRILVLVSLGFGCTIWYTAAPGVYGMAPPTELFPSDVDYVKFFMDSFTNPLFKKMTYLESNFIIGSLLTAYENFYPFTQIDIPVLEVGIPSQATTIASLTTIPDIGSSSQAGTSASSSQMTIP
ncbi:hypothetical protein Tco_1424365 [Tanacetum coccineum]